MRQTRPLPDTHPEFSVIDWGWFTEYRVERWRLARDGSGRVLRRGVSAFSWFVDAVVVVVDAVLAAAVLSREENEPSSTLNLGLSRPVLFVAFGIATVLTCLLIWTRFTQVLHESLLVFPNLGIQLETHRGHPLIPATTATTTRHFIPLSALEDVIIHEGLRGWNVRYYLAALQRRRQRRRLGTSLYPNRAVVTGGSESESEAGSSFVQVHVAFENVLPYFPVLKEVYLGVQQTLFPPSPTVLPRQD